jgi:hypothetical protein
MITVDDDNNLTVQGTQLKVQHDLRFYSETTTRQQNIKTGFESNNLAGNSIWHTIKSFTFDNINNSVYSMGSVEVHWVIKEAEWGVPHGRGKAYRAFYLRGNFWLGGSLVKTDTNGNNAAAEFQIDRNGSTLNLQYRCTNSSTTSVSGTIEILGSNFNLYSQ